MGSGTLFWTLMMTGMRHWHDQLATKKAERFRYPDRSNGNVLLEHSVKRVL